MYYEKKERYKLAFLGLKFLSRPKYHLHNELEIIFNVGGGALAEVFINHKKYMLNPDEGVIIMPGQIHTTNTISEGSFLMISMPVEYIPKLHTHILSQTPNNPVFSLKDEDIRKTVYGIWGDSDIINHCDNQAVSHSIILGYANVLLGKIFFKLDFHDNGKEYELFKDIVLYIAKHYREQITLTDIARDLKSPPRTISKVFNDTANVTIPCHLNWVRASAAADLLISSNKNITEIAYSVGFSTIRSFNRAFTEFYGFTPSKYKKMHK
ncbi:MAG: AraC family transcriptional regulator [Ruminococcaceae bacterium]|nr:AraC family transcriptional regulator [Oscillospiraceae bacterium]